MKRSHEQSSQSLASAKPTTLNLQTRGFKSPQVDLDEETPKLSQVPSSENLLAKLISTPSSEASPSLQRKPQNRLKALSQRSMPIQAKLNIGEPNDKYEQEADATAAKVVQQINSSPQDNSVQRQESMEEDEELQMKPISSISSIQRQESMEEEDEELQMKPMLQRQENVGGGEASEDLESSIQSARGSGQSLDANLQAKMGQAMGADFSGVRVHTDSQSDQLNQSIQAKAFTTGQDVFFRQGEYNPSSTSGQELIAHELTHVMQQNSNSVRRSLQSKTKAPNAKANLPQIHKHSGQSIQRLLSVGNNVVQGDIATITKVHNKVWILGGNNGDSIVVKAEFATSGKQEFEARHSYITWLAQNVLAGVPNASVLNQNEIAQISQSQVQEGGNRGAPTLQDAIGWNDPNLVLLKVETVAMGQNLEDKIHLAKQQIQQGGGSGQKNALLQLITAPATLRELGKMAVLDLVVNNADRFRPEGTANPANIDFSNTGQAIAIDNLDPNNKITSNSWPGENRVKKKAQRAGYAMQVVKSILDEITETDQTIRALKDHVIEFRAGMEQAVATLKAQAQMLRFRSLGGGRRGNRGDDQTQKTIIGNLLASRLDSLEL